MNSYGIMTGGKFESEGVKLLNERDICQLNWKCQGNCHNIELVVLRKELDFLGNPESMRFFVNSENINNGSAGLTWIDPAKRLPKTPEPVSHWWTIIGDSEKRNFHFFGFLTPVNHRSELRVRDGYLEAVSKLDRQVATGEEISSDRLLHLRGGDPIALLEEFGDKCANLTPARRLPAMELAWNSWDYYFSGFEIDDLKENLIALRKYNLTATRPIRNVVIDMGWYINFGDWRANGRFPGGIAEAARLIQDSGFTPGIWVSPYEVNYHTNTFMRNSQILATDLNGNVVLDDWAGGGTGWVDPSSDAGERFLFDTFRNLHSDGFRYFKLDFLHYLITHFKASERKFKNEQLGRMGIVRRGLEIIRSAIGNESYLLGCGCPPEAGIGIVDAMRIGGDISTYHSTVKLLAPFLAGRYWMNNRFFRNDPDFLMTRGRATSDDENLNPFHPVNIADMFGSRTGPIWNSVGEPRIWATLVGMAGGALTLADHLGKLNPAGLTLLQKAVEHHSNTAAQPLDLMDNPLPELWLRKGEKPALAIINWDDEVRELIFQLERYPSLREADGWPDVWLKNKAVVSEGKLKITIPKRDAAWLAKP
ncbi:MAG: hypothetical protein WCP55_04675 [Lentisphaerota bacterium]